MKTGENLALGLMLLLPCLLAWGLRTFFARLRRSPGRADDTLTLAAGNLLVLAFMVSVLALAGECYYRFVHDATDSFGFVKPHRRWMTRYFHLNADGFRDNVPDYHDRIAPGKRRVTFIGDSFTAGPGIKDVRRRFANLIRQRRPNWEIHVGANLGADTPAQLDLLARAAAAGYEFDWVVLVYNINDIASVMPEWQSVLRRIYDQGEPLPARHSWLFNVLYHRIRGTLDRDVAAFYHFVENGYSSLAWEVQQRLLREMVRVVTAAGGRFAVATFPLLRAVDRNSPLPEIHEQLAEFWETLAIPHFDLLEVYRGIPRWRLAVNRHDAHPNEYAHALAADALQPFLERLVASTPPRKSLLPAPPTPDADPESQGP